MSQRQLKSSQEALLSFSPHLAAAVQRFSRTLLLHKQTRTKAGQVKIQHKAVQKDATAVGEESVHFIVRVREFCTEL